VLARLPDTMIYMLSPRLKVCRLDVPDEVSVGNQSPGGGAAPLADSRRTHPRRTEVASARPRLQTAVQCREGSKLTASEANSA